MTSNAARARAGASRYGSLDGMRGVAAIAVVALHEFQWLGAWTPAGGFLAVDLFFVLSGFVIAASYEERLSSGAMKPLEFIKTRFIRFWPLFVLGLGLGVIEAAASLISNHGRVVDVERDAWISLLPGLAMLPCPPLSGLATPLYPLDSVFWSLLFEMLVNLLYVFTRRAWTIPALVLSMAASGSLILLSANPSFEGWAWRDVGMDVVRVMFSFPAGVLVWRLRWVRFDLGPWAGPAMMAICVATFFRADAVTIKVAVLVLFPLLVFLGARSEPIGVVRAVALWLGEISYAVYALHDPVISFTEGALAKLRVTLPGPPLAVGFIFLALLGAWAADKLYDRPLARLLRARAGLRK